MKVVVITTIILIVFLIGSIFFSQYVNNSCQNLLEPIDGLTQAIKNENWSTANELYEDLNKTWDKNKKVWGYLLEHYDTDRIELVLGRLNVYLQAEERSLALGEITELKFVIELIAKKESFSLSNLF